MNELPHWDGRSMVYQTPAIAVMSTEKSHAARAVYIWDPNDPLVFQMHMQVATETVEIHREDFTLFNDEGEELEAEDYDGVACDGCESGIDWGEMGVPVQVG